MTSEKGSLKLTIYGKGVARDYFLQGPWGDEGAS